METIHIVIVEDEEPEAIKLKGMLDTLGYNTSISSGKIAFQQIKTLCPDLVIMDTRIEATFEGTDAIRALQDVSNIPVVLLASPGGQDAAVRKTSPGSIPSLQRPIEIASLRDRKSAV